ncbi:tryptophan--tRNA ligase [Parenemella sanctibonifatiensis]|uniref:Tryptophan--tRNA ligase n=1 Tax=Parenemella sanctibonifatiensis TaxID=2016505 RepID=A0A255EGX9_9ACTN|nr:tryptophan--tRNA ligase [Parenemella sanctibonifatiensis]OYN88682.1 tryptophan--tRNA ligase [Parenemella sanctibonifatiensis]
MTARSTETYLTGIKPTGEPHLGNYVGAIRPALDLAERGDSLYFIADYHALNQIDDAERLRGLSRSVAAAWLACGLDPAKSLIYRQSSVPQIFELAVVLSAVASKGMMNRAHAYKAAVERNERAGRQPDDGVNMGLFNYPILMASDILLMNADIVPVGRDQKQHVEVAAELARRFNKRYPAGFQLKTPRVHLDAKALVEIPGIDGRKMSKSYENTIPLFASPEAIKRCCMKIVTNSQRVQDSARESVVVQILSTVASDDVTSQIVSALEAGSIGWGDAKEVLSKQLIERVEPMREKYFTLMADSSDLDDVLDDGAREARRRAEETMSSLRQSIGIGRSGHDVS